MNHYSLIRIALLVGACGCCITGLAADEDLLGVVEQKLGSPESPNIAPYWDWTSAPDSSMPNARNLNKLSAFGLTFSGRAKLDGGKFNAISYWADDSQLKPTVAEATFKAIASKLEEKHGPAKAADVPNYEDAFTGRTRVFRWHVADEVILLSIHLHPPRASLSLQRIKRAAWLADMGASESEFWQAMLQQDATPPNREERPQEVRACLDQSTIAENNSLSGPEPCVGLLQNYVRENWRRIFEDLDEIAPLEKQKSVLVRAGESLEPREYLELLQKIRDLRIANKISSRVFSDAIGPSYYKEGFLAFNYQNPDVRQFVESLRPLTPPEWQDSTNDILSGKAKNRLERRWAAERKVRGDQHLLLPTVAASTAPMSQMSATPPAPASPSSTISVAESPAVLVERQASTWPWVVGILVLAVIAALVWYRRG